MQNKITTYNFDVVYIPAIEGGYTVTVPSLPGCISEGDTFEAAQQNIREAIELYLEDLNANDNLDNLAVNVNTVVEKMTIPLSTKHER